MHGTAALIEPGRRVLACGNLPMIDTTLLQRAVERGLITKEQSAALVGLAGEHMGAPAADLGRDDEQLRFITGFADIFVTMGLVLFLGALAYFGRSAVGLALTACAAWALAEFFTRRRRMALPSIVLLAIFTAAGFGAIVLALDPDASLGRIRPWFLTVAALGTVLLTALHYRRFAVPITIAAGMAALIGTVVFGALTAAPEPVQRNWNGLLILAGIATFALAMRFDLSDPLRLTRRTDIAFWLHLLAAPLIVHPVIAGLKASSGDVGSANAALVLTVVIALALVALVTDRRAILVSGLAYAGTALGRVIHDVGLASIALPLTLLALGAFILLLSAGWHPLRASLLRALPRPVAARLPHPIGAR